MCIRDSLFTLFSKSLFSSSIKAIPPVIPAPIFLPVEPKITTLPPVIYSQQWSPDPSVTAEAQLFLTANLSPDLPKANNLPPVAP